MGVIHKIGRRKTAVARVYVSEGTGVITVNKKTIRNLLPYSYFTVQSIATNVYDRERNKL
jgi:ribosomal protein S9